MLDLTANLPDARQRAFARFAEDHAPVPIVTAAPDLIPPPLINQLRAGGRMVIPVGVFYSVCTENLNADVMVMEAEIHSAPLPRL